MTASTRSKLKTKKPPLKPMKVFVVGLGLSIIAAVFFLSLPQLDILAEQPFHLGPQRFLFKELSVTRIARVVLRVVFIATCAIALIGLISAALYRKRLFGLDFSKWLYVVLCLIIGPGLIANSLFKDHWGRARPVHVEEFGGQKTFTPVLIPVNQCERNCSFISGEAASIFMMFFAFAFAVPRLGGWYLLLGILVGSFSGLIRMGMGGHFLSDVLFAGLFMVMTASALAWLLLEKFHYIVRENSPLHLRLLALTGGRTDVLSKSHRSEKNDIDHV